MEGHDPATGESDHLVRIRDTWRYVGIKEWIVEGTAKEHEVATIVVMMPSREPDSG